MKSRREELVAAILEKLDEMTEEEMLLAILAYGSSQSQRGIFQADPPTSYQDVV